MRVGRGLCQYLLHKTFRQLPTSLILLLYYCHFFARCNIFPALSIHIGKSNTSLKKMFTIASKCMIKKACIVLLLIFPSLLYGQESVLVEEESDFLDMLTDYYTGEIAYATTAYIEQYWRLAGNAGFDSSIYKVVSVLEQAGYVDENLAHAKQRFTYRIEKRKLEKPTWEPVDASVYIEGEELPLLEFATNRNMLAVNSYTADVNGVELVYVKDIKVISELDVKGKVVFAETSPYALYRAAIEEGGAIGILSYNMPGYLQPEKNKTSIQFRGIPLNPELKPWAIPLSFAAKERLKKTLNEGTVKLNVKINTNIYPSEELTVVANIKGSSKPDERLVFSAHVQEPGANDNASGVGATTEMAVVSAVLIGEEAIDIKRTLTFLWGDEIVSTGRYVEEDSIRTEGIKWGISLDMVGENTDSTGGSFLIEKMPDPSAIWTRGDDEHTEWGGSKMGLEDMAPHYLNDFVLNRFKEQAAKSDWTVKTNPFEGGSDHVPFLRAGIPSVLFWHFTDQFYHTDNDRLDKVSQFTMRNVGAASLNIAYTLLNADVETAEVVIEETRVAGIDRLNAELVESKLAIENGATIQSQEDIIRAWEDWYIKAIASCADMVDAAALVNGSIKEAQDLVKEATTEIIEQLE